MSPQVEPFASLCTLPRFDIPRLLINRELVGPFRHGRKRITDVALTGDLVDTVREIAALAGWTAELQHLAVSGNPDEVDEDNTSVNDHLGQYELSVCCNCIINIYSVAIVFAVVIIHCCFCVQMLRRLFPRMPSAVYLLWSLSWPCCLQYPPLCPLLTPPLSSLLN